MSFSRFDRAVQTNDFWTQPIDRINQGLTKMFNDDPKERLHVSLVVGCPFPEDVQQRITELSQAFDQRVAEKGSNTNVQWRPNLSAIHVTVYGLILPKDFGEGSWPLPQETIEYLQSIFKKYKGFPLSLQGLGILGRGVVSLRISDSKELDAMRKEVSSISGLSDMRFGSATSKAAIGRICSDITDKDRMTVKDVCVSLKDFSVAELKVEALELLYAKNKFLDQIMDSIEFQ